MFRGESGSTLSFNPFNLDFDDGFNTFDDSMCDTLNCANTILQSCSYYEHTTKGSTDDSLSKFYLNNIDGFKTNFNESLINIKSLNCIPSLMAFCETNLDEDDINDFNMIDYNAEHFYAIPGKNKGSGLSIYSHKTNLFRRISSLTIRNKFFECMGGSLQTEYKELIFITVYRFHGNESEFIEHFMKAILSYKDKPLLILGDLNLNLFEYDNNKNIDDFVNSMMSNSLFPLVIKATNFFRGSSTLIDHTWTNILNNSTKCDVVDILTIKKSSSHKPLLSFLPTKLKHFIDESSSNNTNVKLHNINSDSLNNFSNELDSFLSNRSYKYSEPIKNSTMVKSTFSDFYSTVTHLYNKHIVVDKVFKSNRNKYDKPWITTSLAKACKVKSKLHNIWIKSRGTMKENAAKTNYKSYRYKLKKLIQQAELNYFKNKFSNASGNIRKAWSVINSIRCKRKIISSLILLIQMVSL